MEGVPDKDNIIKESIDDGELKLENGQESADTKGSEGEDTEHYAAIERDITQRYEVVEAEHYNSMQNVADFIRDAELERSSSGSMHSALTGSTNLTSNTSKSNAALRAATLKAKLKYIDIEAKTKADLEKIKTMKELEIANAELEVIDSVEDNTPYDIKNALPQDDMNKYVDDYLNKHSFNNQSDAEDVKPSFLFPETHLSKPLTSSVATPKTESKPSDVPAASIPYACVVTTTANTKPTTTGLNPLAREFSIKQTPITTSASLNTTPISSSYAATPSSNTEQGLLVLAKTLADQVNLSRLPPPEPSIFLGDPLKFPGWKAAFHILIEQRQIPPSERIHYLKKYIGGSVREVIENFFLLSTDDAYEEAKKLLDQRYGDPFVVANAFRDKLEKWPKIGTRDCSALQRFADFLRQCDTAMQSIKSLSVLNDDRENRKLLTKLPDLMVTRWGRIVVQRKEERKEFPPFKDFMNFVVKEARIACAPMTSIQSLKVESNHADNNERERRFSRGRQTSGGRSFLTEVTSGQSEKRGFPISRSNISKCVLCDKNHNLDECREFLSKTLDQRKNYAREKGLCFGCLCRGHLSRRCRQRKRCKTCPKLHPTSLHGDVVKAATSENNENVSQETNVKSEQTSSLSFANSLTCTDECGKSSMIVPVYVSHCDKPELEILVYALLDTQSDTTFILEDTCDALGLRGTDTKLLLSTMYAENRTISCRKVKGLSVRGLQQHLEATATRHILS